MFSKAFLFMHLFFTLSVILKAGTLGDPLLIVFLHYYIHGWSET